MVGSERKPWLLGGVAIAITTTLVAPARSQPSPEPAVAPAPTATGRWWESHVPVPRSSSHARNALISSGAPLVGVGASLLFGSGIAWLIGWSSAQDLERECPNKRCVEGTPGGRAYVRAVDGATAAEVMAAIGFPTLAAGLVVLAVGATADEPLSEETPPRVTLRVAPTGASMEVRF